MPAPDEGVRARRAQQDAAQQRGDRVRPNAVAQERAHYGEHHQRRALSVEVRVLLTRVCVRAADGRVGIRG